MAIIQKFLSAVPSSVWLGLLTLFFAHPVVGTVAQSSVSTQPSPVSSPATSLEQGKTLYGSGRFSEAIAVWQATVAQYERQGDDVGQAWTLSYLSLAYQALGQWDRAEQAIEQSLALLQQPEQKSSVAVIAQALNVRGYLQSRRGDAQAALESWQRAEVAYRAAGDEIGVLGSQINQAQALQSLGLYRRAQTLLTTVGESLRSQPDSSLKVKGLKSLAVVYQVTGNLQESKKILEESLAIARRLNAPAEMGEVLFALGNLARDLKEPEPALAYYQQAATVVPGSHVELEALLNQFSLYTELKQNDRAIALLAPIEAKLIDLPPSRTSIYAAVNFAESLGKLAQLSPQKPSSHLHQTAASVLARAIAQAKSLGDRQAQARGLTQLGKLYEQAQQYSEALTLTETAQQVAQQISAPDLSARAAWQMGRLLKQQGDREGAIAAYQSAFNAIESLKIDLVALNRDVRFSFTETVEPVYRQFVALLLEPTAGNSAKVSQKNLKVAREVIEALQLAELENFFREACLDVQPVQIDQIDPQAAAIYPIILPDRLEVIVSLPGQPLRHYATHLPQAEIEKNLRQMRESLNPAFSKQERLRLYQQAYEWMIRPVEADLERFGIKTLVFVLDGYLRNLPMAAFYDGEQYLIEKYGIALSQGLQLLKPRPLKSIPLQAITAGLSESRQGFPALPGVDSELTQISAKIDTEVLLNREFTYNNLEKAIASTSLPILHLATHGQFSSNAEETFVLTWDERINVKELDRLMRSRSIDKNNPIELLVLSACQTASGDNRAVLGLAGIAVRSGARSTLATLWAVRDRSTAALMSEFYKQLKQPGMTKSEALRQAQLALLKQGGEFNHPVHWAAFVLVGNWL
jgi:CHAT domain-containing protein